jgi:hypothetical protein
MFAVVVAEYEKNAAADFMRSWCRLFGKGAVLLSVWNSLQTYVDILHTLYLCSLVLAEWPSYLKDPGAAVCLSARYASF